MQGVHRPERDGTASSDGTEAHPPPTPEHVFCPMDLVPATRRLLLLIVDSDRAAAFARVQELALGPQPLLLLTPEKLPERIRRAATVRAPVHPAPACTARTRVHPSCAPQRSLRFHHVPRAVNCLASAACTCRAFSTCMDAPLHLPDALPLMAGGPVTYRLLRSSVRFQRGPLGVRN